MAAYFPNDNLSLTLRPKREFTGICDGSAIRPSMIARLHRTEVGALRLSYDARSVRLDELFEVIGNPSQHLIFEGNCAELAGIGTGMDGGTILVRGNAGPLVASQMQAGHIEVLGDCRDYLGMGMRSGTVIVHGSAGDYVASPGVGQRRGMNGGDCIVLGNVGSRVAERMRRGTLYIGRNAGDFGAAQMIAGTVIVMGEIGPHWAGGMKRGSIILSHPTLQEFQAELTAPREFELSFLPLLWRHLESLVGKEQTAVPSTRWAMRQLGDRANNGVGEILTLTRPSYR